jgi:hypothetical protein
MVMSKTVALAALLLAGLARADGVSDRADIENLVRSLNQAQSEAAARRLFAPGALGEFERLGISQPWSEISRPYFQVQAVRFVSPDVALVDASRSQYGSLVLRRQAVLFVMKKEGNVWRIVSIRTLAAP